MHVFNIRKPRRIYSFISWIKTAGPIIRCSATRNIERNIDYMFNPKFIRKICTFQTKDIYVLLILIINSNLAEYIGELCFLFIFHSSRAEWSYRRGQEEPHHATQVLTLATPLPFLLKTAMDVRIKHVGVLLYPCSGHPIA